MPSYELSLIIRSALQRPELKSAMMRACRGIYNNGGLIRNMENLGNRELPYKMINAGGGHFHGNYFLIRFDSSAAGMMELRHDFNRDKDIIRTGIVRNQPEPLRPCEYKQCEFGELKLAYHEKSAYKNKVIKRIRNKHFK